MLSQFPSPDRKLLLSKLYMKGHSENGDLFDIGEAD